MKKVIIAGIVALSLIGSVASAQSYYPSYAPTYTSGTTYSSGSSGACLSISTGLTVGSRGSQVLALQQFLVSQNYPGSGTWMETSYFGAATRAALVDFQESQGLPQTGYVDSNTLSALERVSCGGASYVSPAQPIQPYSYPGYPGYTGSTYPYGTTYPYTTTPYTTYPNTTYPYTSPYIYGNGTPTITSLSQNTGTAGQTVTIYGQGFQPTNNTVYFAGQPLSGIPSSGTQISFTIPYISEYANDQIVQLYVTNSDGTSNTVSFTLNPSVSSYGCGTTYPYSYGYNYNTCGCSNTYAYTSNCSTCGYSYNTYPYTSGCPGNTNSPTVTYVSPQSGGVGTDVTVYGTGFTTSNNTIHFGSGIITGLGSFDGQSVSFVVPSQLTGYGSQPLVLGAYQISVTNSNNITTNSAPFTVTSTGSNTGAPTITSVSGPSSLSVNQNGAWQVTINNPNSNYATVSVTWGDTGNGYVNQAAPQTIYGGTQTVSFSHAYIENGTFTVTFTVANQSGQTSNYTSTVIVSGSNTNTGAPSIVYLSPTSGYVGTQVTIYGSNLGVGSDTVYFGSGVIQNVYSNGNYITFTVPSSVGPYCQSGYACPQYLQQVTPGTYNVSVMDSFGTSNTVSFTVL